jgi:hypothetical protein
MVLKLFFLKKMEELNLGICETENFVKLRTTRRGLPPLVTLVLPMVRSDDLDEDFQISSTGFPLCQSIILRLLVPLRLSKGSNVQEKGKNITEEVQLALLKTCRTLKKDPDLKSALFSCITIYRSSLERDKM